MSDDDDERGWIELAVEDLFTNSRGDRADRLVLWSDREKINLGGWSKESVINRLHAHRQQMLAKKPK